MRANPEDSASSSLAATAPSRGIVAHPLLGLAVLIVIATIDSISAVSSLADQISP